MIVWPGAEGGAGGCPGFADSGGPGAGHGAGAGHGPGAWHGAVACGGESDTRVPPTAPEA